MSKNKKKKKKNNNNLINRKIYVSCTLVVVFALLILSLGYYMVGSDILNIGFNSTTASYISFNNVFDSDTIKIDKLDKYNDNDGEKSNSIDFEVSTVNNNLDYEIILVPINVSVDYKYIKFSVSNENDKVLKKDILSNCHESNDFSGNVIYNGKLNKIGNDDKIKLRVWISDEIKDEIKANSFEVKVKLK